MNTELPAQLKVAPIPQFLQRASQLKKVKPIISYWCNYHIVNIILNKGLHTESEECMQYTTKLMDSLEEFKQAHIEEKAVHDDTVAQAYTEQFALETFNRADKALRERRAVVLTADTFLAASNFLDLLGIWQNPSNPDTAQKSKYAKYHAVRIFKAIKAGEDPNIAPEVTEAVATAPLLDEDNGKSMQPTVEEVPDVPSPMEEDVPRHHVTGHTGDVSPLEPEQATDYFPTSHPVPTFSAEETPNIHSAPPLITSPGVSDASTFYTTSVPAATSISPSIPPSISPSVPPFANVNMSSVAAKIPTNSTNQSRYNTDDDSVERAKKHCRFAVSALTFDDVPRAVEELRNALRLLGA